VTETIPESRATRRDDGLWVYPRAEFAAERFDYEPGQHVAFIGPTQRGKTSLAFVLLEHVATPEMPVYILVSKPTDTATSKAAAKLRYRHIPEFPPPVRVRDLVNQEKPSGYVIWPDMSDPATASSSAERVSRETINGIYTAAARKKTRKMPCILMLDDTVTKSKVLHLDNEIIMILTMSGAMGIGGWTFVQKPTGGGSAPIWAYSQSEHLFITRDPDRRNRERLGEIGGFSTRELDEISLSLKPYQFLYLERTHGYKCIVDAK
jgi:hypothetical protein